MGRGKSKASVALVDAAHDILEEIQPATVRAVCYRLFVSGLIASMAKKETNRVSRQLVWAREEGIIPWSWIVDETREAERPCTWDDPETILRAAVSQYRKDYWREQPQRVEVWNEKGTVRGTLAPILREYGVTFRVMHGYGSATALQAVAEESRTHPKPLTILYAGDFDPSGLHMSVVDIPRRLERYEATIRLERVALTRRDYLLPSFEAFSKTSDPRYRWYVDRFGHHCWELDALPPPELRQRVEAAILARLDTDRWEHAKRIEAAEIESMGHVMEAWRSISRQASK